jgi:hypothetical protein
MRRVSNFADFSGVLSKKLYDLPLISAFTMGIPEMKLNLTGFTDWGSRLLNEAGFLALIEYLLWGTQKYHPNIPGNA